MTDDEDIEREVKNMFIRTNMLIRKFNKCFVAVKTTLFTSYCLCFYDIALWESFKVGTMNKFRSCYNKCVKLLFGISVHIHVHVALQLCCLNLLFPLLIR